MLTASKNIKHPAKAFLFFLIVLIIAYLPISSFLFFLKNDAFNNYFPPRFFLSESLRAGYLPFWNPYINFGYPLYGDMNSGFMSPVTWIIAAIPGYNVYSFTVETLLYIFLGGLGMYRLTRFWNINTKISLTAGIAYMCSGYMTGHLQHTNWISGAAFMPWCLYLLLNLLKDPSLRKAIPAAIVFYLLIASSHPGIIIGAIYFFAGVIIFQFINKGKSEACFRIDHKRKKSLLLFSVLLGMISLGLIAGYSDIIPQFTRGAKGAFSDSTRNATGLSSWISLIIPMAIVKNGNFFHSDLSLRNCYIGLLFLAFFIAMLTGSKTAWQKYLLSSALFFFLISLGGSVKDVIQKVFPLIEYVRLGGEFRIFTILSLVLAAGIEAQKYILNPDSFLKKISRIFSFLAAIAGLVMLWASWKLFSTHDGILFTIRHIGIPDHSLPMRIKFLIDHLSFYDCILIHGVIQLILIFLIRKSLLHFRLRRLVILVAADLIIASLLVIPFTGAGKAAPRQIQAVISKSPPGIPFPPLHPIRANTNVPENEREFIFSWSMYNKEIGTIREVPYPIRLNTTAAFYKKDYHTQDSLYYSKPFLFTKNENDSAQIQILSFAPGRLTLHLHAQTPDTLVVLQNIYPHWKATVNGKIVPIILEGETFISLPIQSGDNNIQLSFDPALVRISLIVSLISFICLLLLWAYSSIGQSRKEKWVD